MQQSLLRGNLVTIGVVFAHMVSVRWSRSKLDGRLWPGARQAKAAASECLWLRRLRRRNSASEGRAKSETRTGVELREVAGRRVPVVGVIVILAPQKLEDVSLAPV